MIKCVEVIALVANQHMDDKLIIKAVEPGGHRTGKEAVIRAPVEYERHPEQERILSLFGSIEYEEGYSYKKQRART